MQSPSTTLRTTLLMIAATLYAATSISVVAQTPVPVRSLWDGVFTTEQADRGRVQYATVCARCHGANLEGGMGASLVGTAFWNEWREQSVADMVDYVAKNMPMGRQAAPLSTTEAADLVAFVLSSNDLPHGPAALSLASGTGVRIVPKDGGTGELPSTTLARVVGCLAPQGADRSWQLTKASKPERVKAIDGPVPADAAGGNRQYALKFVLQSLTPLIGRKVSVVGLLIGEAGVDGLNVSTVVPLEAPCD
jgi:S-disulfanyl-L-cysteine oxidoreductase SoxD